MKPRYLLPHSFKKIGWMLFIPSLLFAIIVQHFEYEIPGFAIALDNSSIFVEGKALNNNLTNELAGILLLITGFFVAFSKEKLEDEWVSRVRLESLQWSVYLNYALLLIALIIVFEEAFFYVMIYNMYTILIFFIIRFNFVLHIKDKLFHKTEAV